MVDSPATPLTDDERAELEALRAEKAKREEEERARAERAELEALRAERVAHASAASAVAAPVSVPAPEKPANAPAPRTPASVSTQAAANAPQPVQTEKSFGERMVTSDSVDDDGIPTMPMAQKIIIAICLLAVIGFVIYNFVK